jgi:CMP-N-acetylneuraminic acid synthetase
MNGHNLTGSTDPLVAALVPMRKGSERVPGKNRQELGGRPLYRWVLDALEACSWVDRVHVLTDDRDLVLMQDPDSVTWHQLPGKIADGSMNGAIAWALERIPADVYLQTHATNPFVQAEEFDDALRAFLEHGWITGAHDSMFSVGPRIQKRFWTPDGRPVNHEPHRLIRTQDLEGVHEENSCIYVFTKASFARHRSRIGATPMMHVMSPTLDIDTQMDMVEARRRVAMEATG